VQPGDSEQPMAQIAEPLRQVRPLAITAMGKEVEEVDPHAHRPGEPTRVARGHGVEGDHLGDVQPTLLHSAGDLKPHQRGDRISGPYVGSLWPGLHDLLDAGGCYARDASRRRLRAIDPNRLHAVGREVRAKQPGKLVKREDVPTGARDQEERWLRPT